ncbi:DUF2283 domain-containing protein [Chloroflexi bacterium CFX6]|nr:DUF2283 domain-containing protein [Chloroflexi bacterium CFX6]
MLISYLPGTDVLYIRFDETLQDVINQRILDFLTFDIGKDEKIVGIEILDAKKRINLKNLLPVEYQVIPESRNNVQA